MNVDALIKQYFEDLDNSPKIELFDRFNIYEVYQRVVNGMMSSPDVNISILQAFSYCLYEILDNVLNHSKKDCGIVIHAYDSNKKLIRLLIADDGIGIHGSLSSNPSYSDITEEESLQLCIKDKVSDGKGMGFGLYSMSRLMQSVGINLSICSGSFALILKDDRFVTEKTNRRDGTLIYMEIHADRDIDPNNIVDFRTDVSDQFNDEFLNEDNELW